MINILQMGIGSLHSSSLKDKFSLVIESIVRIVQWNYQTIQISYN